MPGAPAAHVIVALLNRGFLQSRNGMTPGAIADYTRVIESAAADAGQRVNALFNRGLLHGRTGRNEEAIADLTRVIDSPGAPDNLVELATSNRQLFMCEMR